jgi:hypothetical protein
MGSAARVTVVAVLAAAAQQGGSVAHAHVTPPVQLLSDREAVASLLPGARDVVVQEARLSKDERARIQRETGSSGGAEVQRFHVGRDAEGRGVGAVVFVTDYTLHGSVRVAVGLGPDGRITGAKVVEVSEEAYRWVRPFVDHDWARDYVGEDARGRFELTDRLALAVPGAMPRSYGRVLANQLRRAALLFEVGVLDRAGR